MKPALDDPTDATLSELKKIRSDLRAMSTSVALIGLVLILILWRVW